jgi:hypothetical protein
MRDAVESINGPMGQAQVSGSERVNTAFSGSGRVDDDESHPQGEIRGETKLVNTTSFFTQLEWSEWDERHGTRAFGKSRG